jgi:hypothetical protein
MSKPFSRFNSLMAAVAAAISNAMAAGMSLSHGQAVSDLGGYRSRGHGVKTRTASRTCGSAFSGTVAQDQRRAQKARNVKANRRAHR